MSHELVSFPNGSYSVKPRISDEAMHSHIGPWQEARQIYVEQSGLADRLREAGPPLVLFDLGLGIAANGLAAFECFLHGESRRDLVVFSFEKELGGLRLALQNPGCFPWLQTHGELMAELLERRQATRAKTGARFSWRLLEGDFLSQPLTGYPPANLLYFDFYSPKGCPELWDVACFEKLRAACAADACLLTYGASTAARSAMLLAGFYVGRGCPTSAKSETTVAALRVQALKRPLGPEWLGRLARSDKPLPQSPGREPLPRQATLERIHAHPQFGGSR